MNTSVSFSEVPGWLWVVLALVWLAEVALVVWALVVLFRTPEERIVGGKRWIWLLLILLISTIGPIVFLLAGRKPAQAADPLAQGAPGTSTTDRAARAADVLYGSGQAGPPGGGDAPGREGGPQ